MVKNRQEERQKNQKSWCLALKGKLIYSFCHRNLSEKLNCLKHPDGNVEPLFWFPLRRNVTMLLFLSNWLYGYPLQASSLFNIRETNIDGKCIVHKIPLHQYYQQSVQICYLLLLWAVQQVCTAQPSSQYQTQHCIHWFYLHQCRSIVVTYWCAAGRICPVCLVWPLPPSAQTSPAQLRRATDGALPGNMCSPAWLPWCSPAGRSLAQPVPPAQSTLSSTGHCPDWHHLNR